MMIIFRTSIFLLLTLGSGPVLACMPAFPSTELAQEGRNILIGTVESHRSVERPEGAAAPALFSTNSRSLAAPELLVTVKRVEVLRGTAPDTVTAVSPCHLPLRAGDRVVVATYAGRRVAFPAEMYEDSYRAVWRPGP
jgi:hypothetical protein